MNLHYDYIIAGAGCAGLSLLHRILAEPSLQNKEILVIDAVFKNKNDRTWCFWERGEGIFNEIVFHEWSDLQFTADHFSKNFSIDPYRYKMIRGIDFYQYVLAFAKGRPNVHFVQEAIVHVQTAAASATVLTATQRYTATYVFNSILFDKPVGKYNLLQHFKGWLIESEQAIFNPSQATFMDFSIDQKQGTSFMYLLPTSTRTALIEYTLFTQTVLPDAIYDAVLNDHIQNKLAIGNFNILHEEFGVIPMTDFNFPVHDGHIVHIGTAGGQTKPSSGFTFQFIQKQTAAITHQLLHHQPPFLKPSFRDKKFKFYDTVLLQVLCKGTLSGAEIFTSIFQKNNIQTVLKFLDNETSFLDDLKILVSVSTKKFLPAAVKEICS